MAHNSKHSTNLAQREEKKSPAYNAANCGICCTDTLILPTESIEDRKALEQTCFLRYQTTRVEKVVITHAHPKNLRQITRTAFD